MSRLAGFLVPRFGVAWLLVAMLFLISAAGWWKFHRDLYVEEQAAVEVVKRSWAKIAVHRIDFQFPRMPAPVVLIG